jgi:hypothetical protein
MNFLFCGADEDKKMHLKRWYEIGRSGFSITFADSSMMSRTPGKYSRRHG